MNGGVGEVNINSKAHTQKGLSILGCRTFAFMDPKKRIHPMFRDGNRNSLHDASSSNTIKNARTFQGLQRFQNKRNERFL